jgi:hypothetical protein
MGMSEISKAARTLAVAERKLVKLAENGEAFETKALAKLDKKYDAAVAKITVKLGEKTSKASAAVAAAKKALTDLVAKA